ncbi:hypothetical protein KX928_05915 [Roseobacter sp. YSTF-M11]|uniref:Lipoprotein n=1 Tax=Roseobacter insulae TaxID=2859783 RepID=A0A9X1FT56_9RHOB|nr:hypothetical protein [Roseobacter insulae]MBW4707319.1 hypothetical protein [Roseobacter insulae]
MKTKTILSIFAASVILMGCAETGHYPLTGKSVGASDHVKFMSNTTIARY